MAKHSKADVTLAHERLREVLKPAPFTQRANGTRDYGERGARQIVYQIVRHVSKSGMQREISTYVSDGEGGMRNLDWAISVVTGSRIGKHDGVVIGGCGMDMGFALLDHACTVFRTDTDRAVNANDFDRRWL
jgi:hypothetical protein